ncbi:MULTISPECIES: LysR family transcriptional regulator [Sphingomonadales]|uniref:LysR family transcriptional regulator n=2 Tax=Edaphosphingomonas TaxID=3423724 RepID=A0A2T4HPE9_9SPHN|nr:MULTISPECIES: LysR family transcriptional regulator [Sphingomonas]AGH49129.1 LysR family transcriptional regulator [Sphingomonas sp. MM-1]MDX3883637.1 LysR family transcriptional regulator [Sphingomonas sp.]OHT21553.1 HTH-type transcriptional regulator CynR [Sphingomonas haloaromaticamans]PTD17646.1 LysR family transcriptional regulator [Sphingomonas fennica]
MWDNALHYFYEAASLGSMRLASDKIGVAVSSISRQIAQLESEMGISLIERGRRSIRLTDAGRLTYEYYRSQLADREALLSQIHALREVRTGRINLAVGEGFFGPAFNAVIDGFQRRNPGVTITIATGADADLVRMVLEDEAHIGLILNGTNEPKIRVRATISQPLMLLCAPRHPAARLEAPTIGDLAGFDLCLPPKGFPTRALLDDAERRAQAYLEPRLVTASLHMMRETAKAGRMVTVLPRICALAEIGEGSLVARPLCDPELKDSAVSLIHRLGRQLDGAPMRLLGLLEAKLKALGEPEPVAAAA